MNRAVIFLDFDGVLNTEQYQAQLAIEGKPTKDAWGPLFDPRAVDNLRKILEATDAGIIISSSWRWIHRLGSLRMMWDVRELPGEILDTLPCGAQYISRGEDIEYWLDRNRRPDYVIIDDLDDFFPSQRDRYVETNPIIGITEADAKKAIEMLRARSYDPEILRNALLTQKYSKMNNEISTWNGFPVHGDVKELDRIVESDGFINLGKEDIIEMLSATGINYVATGTGDKINDAFDNAVANLPCNLDNSNSLLISFHCGKETNNNINDLAKISRTLLESNSEASVKWGIAVDYSLAETFKVVLVASEKS